MSASFRLRPHHLLDVVTQIGQGVEFKPAPTGHAEHLVAERVLAHPDAMLTLMVGADDICAPCRRLGKDGRCRDRVNENHGTTSKQEYNDRLDRRLLACLKLEEGTTMAVRDFLVLVGRHLPGIETICAHPGQKPENRLSGLRGGLDRLLGGATRSPGPAGSSPNPPPGTGR